MFQTITRTGKQPLAFDGEKLGEHYSAGKPVESTRNPAHARWWEVAIYRTESGKLIAHIRYRVGPNLPRELPIDDAIVASSEEEVIARLREWKWQPHVYGWPHDGRFDDRNVALMKRLATDYLQLVVKCLDTLKPVEPEYVT